MPLVPRRPHRDSRSTGGPHWIHRWRRLADLPVGRHPPVRSRHRDAL